MTAIKELPVNDQLARVEPSVVAAEEMFGTALGVGGTLTDEHGVGALEKR
jgi:hypothetical protein